MVSQIEEQSSRDRILQAAAEIFAAVGFDGARVDAIAERARINKALVYYHVGDKETLYTEVFSDAIGRGTNAIRAASEGSDDPEERIRGVVAALGEALASHPVLPSIILREVAGGGGHLPDSLARRMAGAFGLVAAILEDGVRRRIFRKVDPLLTHMMLIGSLFFLMAGAPVRKRVRALVGRTTAAEEPEDVAGHVADVLLNGLVRRDAPAAKRARRAKKERR